VSVLARRCPNCGSTQDAAGACDTCHEAEVRLFCPNHEPGRWLDAPPCAACGATLEAGPTRGPAPRPTPAPPRPPARDPVRERDPVRGPAPVPTWPREAPPAPPPRPRRPVIIEDAEDAPAPPPLGGWPLDPRTMPPVVRVGLPSVMGCLGRLFMIALLLLALVAAAFSWLVWG
jgi:hypothetical protein